MKIVDKLLKEQKFQFPHPMDIVADLAFNAGYQAAIDRITFLSHIEAIDGHCSKILLDDLQREEVEDVE